MQYSSAPFVLGSFHALVLVALFPAWAIPRLTANEVRAVWSDRADGQQFDCNGPLPGGEYAWPDNDLWRQDLVVAPDACGRAGVAEPSNWSTFYYPDNSRGLEFQVLIASGPPVDLDIPVSVHSLILTPQGGLNILEGGELAVTGGSIFNDGTIRLASHTAAAAELILQEPVYLGGSGSLLFDSGRVNRIVSDGDGDVLMIGPLQTVSTSPETTALSQLLAGLVNEGVVEASGGVLELAEHDKTNEGIFRSTRGGDLRIHGITVQGTGGQIVAAAGSNVSLAGATIQGGALGGSGGTIRVQGPGSVLDGSEGPVTINFDGAVSLHSGSDLTLRGDVENNGVLVLHNEGLGAARLRFAGPQMLSGTGEVRIARNGHLNVLDAAEAGSSLDLGAVQLLNVEPESSIEVRLPVRNQGMIFADGNVRFTQSGSLENLVTGRIVGSGAVDLDGGTLLNSGTIEPGRSVGRVSFKNGILQQTTSGRLEFELQGTEPATGYDQLVLAADAHLALGGSLNISLGNRRDGYFTPRAGDQFQIVAGEGGISGAFSRLMFPSLEPHLQWKLVYLSRALVLAVLPVHITPGDYNGNGRVEQGDLDLVLLNWGRGATPLPAGWIGDSPTGLVDQNEVDRLLLNWGDTALPASGAGSVPEPAGLCVASILLAMGLARRAVMVRRHLH